MTDWLVFSGRLSARKKLAPKATRHPLLVGLVILGAVAIGALVIANARSSWISENGGLASWLQATGSILAILAVAYPVLIQSQMAALRARQTVLLLSEQAVEIMAEVAHSASGGVDGPEWWAPSWHVVDQLMANCPIVDIGDAEIIREFIVIRELFGRMRAWAEADKAAWPVDGATAAFLGGLYMNAHLALERLRTA